LNGVWNYNSGIGSSSGAAAVPIRDLRGLLLPLFTRLRRLTFINLLSLITPSRIKYLRAMSFGPFQLVGRAATLHRPSVHHPGRLVKKKCAKKSARCLWECSRTVGGAISASGPGNTHLSLIWRRRAKNRKFAGPEPQVRCLFLLMSAPSFVAHPPSFAASSAPLAGGHSFAASLR
jgi:hypothetical protein